MIREEVTRFDAGPRSCGQPQESGALAPDDWSRVGRLYAPLVLYWCQQREVHPSDAEAVLTDVLVTVATHMNALSGHQPEAFRQWLRSTTWRKVDDLLRARGVSDAASAQSCADQAGHPVSIAPDAMELAREDQILYLRVVELARWEFEEQDWTAFYQVVVLDESPSEVAAALEMTLQAVYFAKSRVLRWVRRELARSP